MEYNVLYPSLENSQNLLYNHIFRYIIYNRNNYIFVIIIFVFAGYEKLNHINDFFKHIVKKTLQIKFLYQPFRSDKKFLERNHKDDLLE